MILLPTPLRPPLRKPQPTSKPSKTPPHLGTTVPIPQTERQKKFAASPKPAAAPAPPTPKPPQEYFCRSCDRRALGTIPPGWWSLGRRVIRGSLPAPWSRNHVQSMGLFCSLRCVFAALPRLEQLEADLNARGVGMRPLAPGEPPPQLPPPVKRGGPQE
jgi:hypothetical protein